jgi:hypothetical protein
MAVRGWAEGNGFAVVRAEVMGSNGRALRFYEKFGFGPVGGGGKASGVMLSRPVGGGGMMR